MLSQASRVLVLGGTAEARDLAKALVDAGLDTESSLAGRVSSPRLPVGRVRIGGFGGAQGLAAYLREQNVTHLVDATHPFAARMSANAISAVGLAGGVQLLRLVRPGWGNHPNATQWQWVSDLTAGRDALEQLGQRPFVTTGRQSVPFFHGLRADHVLLRVVDPMAAPGPGWTVVHDRGPYAVASEIALMREHGVDALLTKDSGGVYTSAKLEAAADLDIPVVVVSRPPGSPVEVLQAHGIPDVLAWLARQPN